MNKFNKLAALGSTIIIGLSMLCFSLTYFGIKDSQNHHGKMVEVTESAIIDTIRVVEKVHDTIRIEIPCERAHCDSYKNIKINQGLNRLDSLQKDTQIHGN